MNLSRQITAFGLAAAVICSCTEAVPEPVGNNGRDDSFYKVKATYAGVLPVSGEPLKATIEEGLAPVWIYKAIAAGFAGYSYPSVKSEFPDIFILKNSGTSNDADDPYDGGYCFVCRYQGKSSDGRTIFTSPQLVEDVPWERTEKKIKMLDINGQTYAVQMTNSMINVAKYDRTANTFGNYVWSNPLSGISGMVQIDIIPGETDIADVYVLTTDGTAHQESHKDVYEGYYDAYGNWRGTVGNAELYHFTMSTKDWTQQSQPEQIAESTELIYMPQGFTYFEDKAAGKKGYLFGNKFKSMKFASADNPSIVEFLTDGAGESLTNPCLINRMMTIHDPQTGSRTDFITSGEGAFYLYRFTGSYDENGAPLYYPPEDLLAKNSPLYGGSLVVPTVVDWDSDGVLDIISGNSEGRIAFFKNYATNASPAFGEAEYLMSCGEEVQFCAGYFEVQGPDDGGAWGYICPNVIDWDGDGILDIVTSSNSTRVEVMLGTGSKTADCLGPRMTVTLNGGELWGMWRVRPAVTEIDGEIYMAFMDTEDALHLYKKTSLTSVEDCGQLRMTDGNIMTGHRAIEEATSTLGERGRAKLEFADWDGDGVIDLIIGTSKQGSFPNPDYGLPYYASGIRSFNVIYLRNAGTNENMVFEYPKQFKFLDRQVNLGSHAQSPCICNLGDTSYGPNLLVGCESGRFYFYSHKDLHF